ncbi:7737_t:CDS:2, partial [Ambispora leptoticha]
EIQLAQLKQPPPYLELLLTGEDSESNKPFVNKIRAYNQVFAFTSISGATLDKDLANAKQGVYTYKIKGQHYHQYGSLMPKHIEDKKPKPTFAQIYFYDGEDFESQINRRHKMMKETLNKDMLEALQWELYNKNPFVQTFISAKNKEQEYQKLQELHEEEDLNEKIEVLYIALHNTHSKDMRNYNTPTAAEIAVVYFNFDNQEPNKRDILIYRNDNRLVRISEMHGAYDPLQYPLLFLYEEYGWHKAIEQNIKIIERQKYLQETVEAIDEEIEFPISSDHEHSDDNEELKSSKLQQKKKGKRKTVTIREFVVYRFMIRDSNRTKSTLHYAGRLFQQYIVDQYVKWKTNNLCWQYKNQAKLRTETYYGLNDMISNEDANINKLGKQIILPSSFTGSTRYFQQLYQDAMAIVREFGKPNLFITVTCNPTWPEITNELLPNQKSSDRPDLIARVFKLKLNAITDDLFNKGVLGKVIAHVHVIEFQKRGLLHVHILMIMAPEDKPQTPEDFDRIVSAEIPDKDKQPKLYKTISKNMIHGPCGSINPSSPCMVDRKCSKYFPRDFATTSTTNKNRYPTYRRRNNKRIIKKKSVSINIDNIWIVPYNPYLS